MNLLTLDLFTVVGSMKIDTTIIEIMDNGFFRNVSRPSRRLGIRTALCVFTARTPSPETALSKHTTPRPRSASVLPSSSIIFSRSSSILDRPHAQSPLPRSPPSLLLFPDMQYKILK